MSQLDIVTGAFSYTGRFVAPRLLQRGRRLRTLTNHPNPQSQLFSQVEVAPLDFSRPDKLVDALRGADTLYNTYWVRSTHGAASFEQAVTNTGMLIDAARQAGLRRIVHVSIANPEAADLPYYKGKAQLERRVRESDISFAIVRPTLLFGHGDVLINNISWFIRHLPAFVIPGDGQYRLQPVFVEDYADRIVDAGASTENLTIDVAGPEIFSFESLVRMLRDAMGLRRPIVHMPPRLALAGAGVVSLFLRDITLTGNELRGLMAELLISKEPSTCPTRLSDWARGHQAELGKTYASELDRHYRTVSPS
ncbi:MAG TPA: NAD(P)H-binding protein [Candidatus Dormibacteraeota bacterium]|nr:NAD(P)H-binding protein [Candidatus Dormibacteraeota bacterium]